MHNYGHRCVQLPCLPVNCYAVLKDTLRSWQFLKGKPMLILAIIRSVLNITVNYV